MLAQNTDSLDLALAQMPADTSKVRLLCEAAHAAVPQGPQVALRYAQEAIGLCDRLKFPGKTAAYLAVSRAYVRQEDWPNALDYAQRAASAPFLKEKTGDNARALALGGAILCQLARSSEALEWERRALAATPANLPEHRAAVQNALAVLHGMQGQLDSSQFYLEKARRILLDIPEPRRRDNAFIVNTFNDVASNFGSLLLERGQADKAAEKFAECLLLDETAKNAPGQALDYLNLASAFFAQHKTGEALAWLEKSRALLLKPPVTSPDVERAFFPGILARWKNYPALRDSLLGMESRDADRRALAELREKEREREIREQEKELDRAARERLWLLGGLTLVSVLSALFFWQRSKTHRANRTLEARNAEIRRQAEKLDLLMRELHHRVKNNLQMVSSLLNLQSRQVGDENAAAALHAGRLRVDAMSLIHQRLYRSEGVTKVNVADFARDLIEKIAFAYGFSPADFDLEIEFDPAEAEVDKALPFGLIINELLTNSFKYAFVGDVRPQLCMSLGRAGDRLVFRYSDNGCGFPEHVFASELSESFGMRLIRSLSKQLGGQAVFRNANGAQFEVVFA